jgi:hypothetical protein
VLLYGSNQFMLVPASRNVIEDYPGDIGIRLEVLVAAYQCCHALCHTGGIDYQYYGALQHSGYLGSASALATVEAVIKPHSSLNDRQVSSTAGLLKGGKDYAFRHQDAIQVTAIPPCRCGKPRGVNIIGPLFERLHRKTALREGST